MNDFSSEPGLIINLANSQVDLSLSQITETIIDAYYDENDLEKSDLDKLNEDLHMLKEINSSMNKSLIDNNSQIMDLQDSSLENIDFNKLVELTPNVDEAIIKEQNEEIQKVEQELNELHEMVNEVNKIVVINREDLEVVEQTVEKADVDIDTGIHELKEASTYVNWLTHKNTKIAGAATVVGLATGGAGYLLGAGVIVASGIAVAAGVATGTGTKVALKSISQKLSF